MIPVPAGRETLNWTSLVIASVKFRTSLAKNDIPLTPRFSPSSSESAALEPMKCLSATDAVDRLDLVFEVNSPVVDAVETI